MTGYKQETLKAVRRLCGVSQTSLTEILNQHVLSKAAITLAKTKHLSLFDMFQSVNLDKQIP